MDSAKSQAAKPVVASMTCQSTGTPGVGKVKADEILQHFSPRRGSARLVASGVEIRASVHENGVDGNEANPLDGILAPAKERGGKRCVSNPKSR